MQTHLNLPEPLQSDGTNMKNNTHAYWKILLKNSHSSVFNNASFVHLLSDPVNHEDDVCRLRRSVLRRGLLDETPMEPRSTAGG